MSRIVQGSSRNLSAGSLMSQTLDELLRPFGAESEDIIDLSAELTGAARLDYRDLQRLTPGRRPDAVVRIAGRSVAYVMRGESGAAFSERVIRLRHLLAQRDDAAFLVVTTPGRLVVYGVGLDRKPLAEAQHMAIAAHDVDANATFRRLGDEEPANLSAIHEEIFRLLTNAIDGLRLQGMDKSDAIALAGRALFIRFLIDRGILGGARKTPTEIAAGARTWSALFADAKRVRETCAWIDKTFNGDFKIPSPHAVATLQTSGFRLLAEMVDRRKPEFGFDVADGGVKAPVKWGELDFSHIPVGLLSQAYEVQHRMKDRRKADSVYYTPRRIAEYLVREAFARLKQRLGPGVADVRVLDPAAGGGILLIAAFRELAAAHETKTGRWPTSRRLRSILVNQLYGYDIQQEALSFTSLSLYLTALELDESAKGRGYRFEELKFEKPLCRYSLFCTADAHLGETAGSLGPAAPAEHLGFFDMVIANPPWTSIPGKAGNAIMQVARDITRETVAERLGEARERAFDFPDKVPDLPFVWRAMQWAKPGGVLAFALHGRVLFKSTPKGQRARQDIFDAISVWGVLNGAELRFTPVWPEVTAPFCLLLADNTPAPPDHVFHFASPYYEPGLNAGGRLRIDPDAVESVELARLRERPMLLKAMFRGTSLDVRLVERFDQQGWPSLAAWMADRGLQFRQGFQIRGDQNDPGSLRRLPLLEPKRTIPSLEIDTTTLPPFPHATLHRPRERAIYEGPLLLVREAVRKDSRRIHVCPQSVAFSESFYGLSFSGIDEGLRVAQYLALVMHSPLFVWFTLMTSGKFGVEREAWLKTDLERFPIVPFESLAPAQRAEVDALFARLAAEELPSGELLTWTCALYGLGRRAAEVIADTLQAGLPFPENKAWAASHPEPEMVEGFAARLVQRLKPFADLQIRVGPRSATDPYQTLVVGRHLPDDAVNDSSAQAVMRLADRLGSSEYVYRDEANGVIWLGRLAQRRYWTLSRARLTAARLANERMFVQ